MRTENPCAWIHSSIILFRWTLENNARIEQNYKGKELGDMDKFTFIKAVKRDVDEIQELIQKRIQWMEKNNINQWNRTNYLDSYPRRYFEDKVEAGQLYVMQDELRGRVIGAVVLLAEDKRWNNEGSRKNYYIHNLVTDTEVPGGGQKIINLCEQIAVKNGASTVRLDCQASNIKLNEYYSGLGYCYVGDVQEGSYIGNKREKKLHLDSQGRS